MKNTGVDYKWVINPYLEDSIYPRFSGEISTIIKKGKHGLIDINGQILVECIADDIIYFDNLIPIKKGNLMGLIDSSGATILPCEYDRYDYIAPYFIVFEKGVECTIINSKGEIVQTEHPIRSFHDNSFSEEVVGVEVWLNNKTKTGCGFINNKGESVTSFKYHHINKFSNNVACVSDNFYHYFIDKNEQTIFECPENSSCSHFDGELCLYIEREKGYGFLNKEYRIVIEPQFDVYQGFKDGLYYVGAYGKGSSVIDAFGNEIVPFSKFYSGFSPQNQISPNQWIVWKSFYKKNFKSYEKKWSFNNTYSLYSVYDNEKKKEVVPAIYDYIRFSLLEKVVIGSRLIDKKNCLIDLRTKQFTDFEFDYFSVFWGNKIWVKKNGLWGVIELL